VGLNIAIVVIGQIPIIALVAGRFVIGQGAFSLNGSLRVEWVSWVVGMGAGVGVTGSHCWVCSGTLTSGQCCCISTQALVMAASCIW